MGISIKLHVGMRALRLVDLTEGGFFGEECCRKRNVNPKYMSTATATEHCELLIVPRKVERKGYAPAFTHAHCCFVPIRLDVQAYMEVAQEFKEVIDELDPLLEQEERRRLIKLRWKKACAKVVIANRWNKSKDALKNANSGAGALKRSRTKGNAGFVGTLRRISGGESRLRAGSKSELFGNIQQSS